MNTPDSTRDVIVDALRSQADQRMRAGLKLAVELEELRAAGTDVRPRAVRLVTWLAGAQALRDHADTVEAGPRIEHLRAALTSDVLHVSGPISDLTPPDDDGTSPEAQRVAALAGLTPTQLEQEDAVTGATAEDALDDDTVSLGDPAIVLADVGTPQ